MEGWRSKQHAASSPCMCFAPTFPPPQPGVRRLCIGLWKQAAILTHCQLTGQNGAPPPLLPKLSQASQDAAFCSMGLWWGRMVFSLSSKEMGGKQRCHQLILAHVNATNVIFLKRNQSFNIIICVPLFLFQSSLFFLSACLPTHSQRSKHSLISNCSSPCCLSLLFIPSLSPVLTRTSSGSRCSNSFLSTSTFEAPVMAL